MLLLCLTVIVVQVAFTIGHEETTCLSRFDYDYKMLSKMLELETEMKSSKDTALNQIQSLKDRLDEQGNTQTGMHLYMYYTIINNVCVYIYAKGKKLC